jgi:thiamine-monophosphate kinase
VCGVTALDAVAENVRLATWDRLLRRAPNQLGGLHGSDAELLPIAANGDSLLALNVDTIVEEIAAGLYDPFTAGYVAVAGALSDLASVGAAPLGVLLAVTLPGGDAGRIQEAVARGAREACDASATWVLGGDTSEARSLAVTCSAVGVVARRNVRTRIGVQPGDRLIVSGPVGAGALFAARRLLGGFDGGPFRPRPRFDASARLSGIASACIDTSDGLIAALDQLSRLNGVRVRITTPVSELLLPTARVFATETGLPPLAFAACSHGEYELLAVVPEEAARAATEAGFLDVGRVEAGNGVFAEDRLLPTARIRNLWEGRAGDPRSYLAGLLELL